MRQGSRYKEFVNEERDAPLLPIRNLAVIVASICVIESALMLMLHITDMPLLVELGLNVALLITLSFPFFYFLLYRPLVTQLYHTDRAYDALRFFRASIDISADGIFIIDRADMRFIDMNETACRSVGYSRDELLNMGPHDIKPRYTREGLGREFDNIIEGRIEKGIIETVLRRKDGSEFPVEVFLAHLKSYGRDVMVAVARDITDRMKAERALRDSQEMYKLAERAGNIGSWDWNILTGELRWSDTIEPMFGFAPGEFGGTYEAFMDSVHPDDRQHLIDSVNAAVEQNKAYAIEHRIVWPDKTVRWVSETGSVYRDDDGRAVRMVGIVQDIMEKRAGAEALRREMDKAQRYLDTVEVIIVSLDTEGRIILINRKGCELLGYSEDELLGKDWFADCLPQPEGKEVVCKVFKEISAGNIEVTEHYENEILTRSGDRRLIAWHNSFFRDEEGNIIGTLSAGEDITERKKAEEEKEKLHAQLIQAQKMETIGTLAGGIAHDLNNILLPIMNYTQLALMDHEMNKPVKEYLEQIIKLSNRAKDLVRQILTFGRRREKELKTIDMGLVIKEVIKLLRAVLPSSIDIKDDVKTEGCFIKADPTQMHQMIINLAANAGHAMSQSGGTLWIEVTPCAVDEWFTRSYLNLTPGKYIRLSISDTGYGMDDRTLRRIFDPFFTTKGVGEGTGLGLSVVHGIVLSHGGEIDVKSEPGKGTTFDIYLPCVGKEGEEEAGPDIEKSSIAKERILLVDDEEDVTLVLKKTLERLGYHVTARTSSLEALEEFRNEPDKFDLVVTDYTMPKMNGLQLVDEMKKIREGIPIILTSGIEQVVQPEIAEQYGIRETMTKPFTAEDLNMAIRRVLSGEKN